MIHRPNNIKVLSIIIKFLKIEKVWNAKQKNWLNLHSMKKRYPVTLPRLVDELKLQTISSLSI